MLRHIVCPSHYWKGQGSWKEGDRREYCDNVSMWDSNSGDGEEEEVWVVTSGIRVAGGKVGLRGTEELHRLQKF